MKSRITLLAVAGALIAGATVHAAEPATRSGVTYVSGGIGADAEERLRAQRGEYNLMLVFTLTEGNYLADVDVRLADAKGATLVEHIADGPYFLAKMPPGRYTVTASYQGKAQVRTVNVGAKGLNTLYLRWPSNPAEDYVISATQR